MAAPAKGPDNVATWFEIPAADFARAVGFYAHFVDSEGNRVGLHSIE